ncbi:hypothetical protein D3C86_1271940 [compost metagenome]
MNNPHRIPRFGALFGSSGGVGTKNPVGLVATVFPEFIARDGQERAAGCRQGGKRQGGAARRRSRGHGLARLDGTQPRATVACKVMNSGRMADRQRSPSSPTPRKRSAQARISEPGRRRQPSGARERWKPKGARRQRWLDAQARQRGRPYIHGRRRPESATVASNSTQQRETPDEHHPNGNRDTRRRPGRLRQRAARHPRTRAAHGGPVRPRRSAPRLRQPGHAGKQVAGRPGAPGLHPLPAVPVRRRQEHSRHRPGAGRAGSALRQARRHLLPGHQRFRLRLPVPQAARTRRHRLHRR